MEVKIVKVSDKGQISIPIDFRKLVDIKKGDKLMMVETGKKLLLEKVSEKNFKDLLKHSEKVAEKLWGSKKDEVWDKL